MAGKEVPVTRALSNNICQAFVRGLLGYRNVNLDIPKSVTGLDG